MRCVLVFGTTHNRQQRLAYGIAEAGVQPPLCCCTKQSLLASCAGVAEASRLCLPLRQPQAPALKPRQPLRSSLDRPSTAFDSLLRVPCHTGTGTPRGTVAHHLLLLATHSGVGTAEQAATLPGPSCATFAGTTAGLQGMGDISSRSVGVIYTAG